MHPTFVELTPSCEDPPDWSSFSIRRRVSANPEAATAEPMIAGASLARIKVSCRQQELNCTFTFQADMFPLLIRLPQAFVHVCYQNGYSSLSPCMHECAQSELLCMQKFAHSVHKTTYKGLEVRFATTNHGARKVPPDTNKDMHGRFQE